MISEVHVTISGAQPGVMHPMSTLFSHLRAFFTHGRRSGGKVKENDEGETRRAILFIAYFRAKPL